VNVRVAVVVVCAAALLAGCGTASSSPPPPDGVGYAAVAPAVTLSVLACEPLAWCVAAGTNPTATSRAASIEVSAGGRGRWAPAATPPITSATLSAAACWSSGCLLGGADAGGSLLLLVNPAHKVASQTSSRPPGSGIAALSCTGPGRCLALVTGASSTSVFETTNSGGSWTMRGLLPPSLVATSLTCANPSDCVAAGAGPNGAAAARSVDGGARWSVASAPHGFSTFTSVSCASSLFCLGTAREPTGASEVVESTDGGQTWPVSAVGPDSPATSTCVLVPTCVVGGGSGSGAITTGIRTTTAQQLTLAYVPDPVISVACATPVKCAAITPASTVSFIVPA
jgi:hypothetical protein